MSSIVSSCVYFFEFFIVFLVYSQLFYCKNKVLSTLAGGFVLFTAGCLQFLFLNNPVLNTVVYLMICIIWAKFGFKSNLKQVIIISIIMTVLMTTTEFISMVMITMILHIDISQYASEFIYYTLFSSLSILIYLVLSLILIVLTRAFKIKKLKTNKPPIFIFIYPICAIFTIFVYWIISSNNNITEANKVLIITSVSLTLFSIIATYAFYFYTSNKENELFELKISMEKIKIEEDYYKLLEYQSEELKKFIHDEKNHLEVIKSISSEKDVIDYISEISDEIHSYKLDFSTENKFLDCILNKYKLQCDNLKISFDTNIRTSNLSFMSNSDTTALISNLLDNAVLAAQNSAMRRIELSINKALGMIAITCTNSCDNKPQSIGDNLITTKNNSGYHGVGTKSIKKVVKKYNGEYTWRYDETDHNFITVIALKIQKTSL